MAMQLKALRAEIKRQAKMVNLKSHSHNIISSVLQQIAEEFGDSEANRAITDFKLEQLGWNCKPCKHCNCLPCGCGG